MTCYSPLKGYKGRNGALVFAKRDSVAAISMEVACGQCLGCRLDRSRKWAIRIMHEASMHDHNCFVTLTYRDVGQCTDSQYKNGHYLPGDGSLNKKHFQDFMKRARQRFWPEKIRYYHCGEYGDQLQRPHYHACLFNFRLPDKQLFKNSNGNPLFVSETLDQLWPYGFATVGELTYQSAAYCARYVLKKVTGSQADEHYQRVDADGVVTWVEPEYTTMSLRPGIGQGWYEKYKSDVFPSDESPILGSEPRVIKGAPRYYDELARREDSELMEQVKAQRREWQRKQRHDSSPERLRQRYLVKKAQVEQLRRCL